MFIPSFSSASASARRRETRDSVTPRLLGDLGHRPLAEEVLLHDDPQPLGQRVDGGGEVPHPLGLHDVLLGVGRVAGGPVVGDVVVGAAVHLDEPGRG
ncbi:hypothetical protein GCM10025868_41380 [Angustibacter aerolatus]|uniref:Uncharacterized protein n=1 Tax=Angustibacter aerolatus TaxID=1162965 RepID=A0ABQ6JKY5_9ACTN|nr:hypothetical protein GCM10025868_41380 [Angustibacter aerolatus]